MMKQNFFSLMLVSLFVSLLVVSMIFPFGSGAQPGSGGGRPPQGGQHGGMRVGPQGGPPPEAISACSNKQDGEICEFQTPHGLLNGTCRTMYNQTTCLPEGMPPGGFQGGQQQGQMGQPGQQGQGSQGQMGQIGQPGQQGQQGQGPQGQMPGGPPQGMPGMQSTQTFAPYMDAIPLANMLVDTGQMNCYDTRSAIACPSQGDTLYGQDAHYQSKAPAYQDNSDGTVTDLNTGLIWQQNPGKKMTYAEAVKKASSFRLAGYSDWRLPTIKELYSLIQFSGIDIGPQTTPEAGVPFIDTDYFTFEYGDTNAGERIIDSQYISATTYVSTTMNGVETAFGVNFADGRIKGYPTRDPGQGKDKTFYVLYVRGNPDYDSSDFQNHGNGAITDRNTGLMWMQNDSGKGMDWEDALGYCEKLEYAGYSDWRLPNARELQSLVDYTRSPATTNSAAIDPIFSTSVIPDEGGHLNYPFYWTSTTHTNEMGGGNAVYIAFGEALGWMQTRSGNYELMDVHGAGAQRSDPKTGDATDYPQGHGPQGDVVRINNYVRCVRN